MGKNQHQFWSAEADNWLIMLVIAQKSRIEIAAEYPHRTFVAVVTRIKKMQRLGLTPTRKGRGSSSQHMAAMRRLQADIRYARLGILEAQRADHRFLVRRKGIPSAEAAAIIRAQGRG